MSAQNVRGQNLEGERALGDRKGGGGSKATRVRGNSLEDEDSTLTREALASLLRHARGRAMPEGDNEDAEAAAGGEGADPNGSKNLGIAQELGEDGRGGYDPTEMGDGGDGDTKALANAGDNDADEDDESDEVMLLRGKSTKAKSR